jgi:hypothetical protein
MSDDESEDEDAEEDEGDEGDFDLEAVKSAAGGLAGDLDDQVCSVCVDALCSYQGCCCTGVIVSKCQSGA